MLVPKNVCLDLILCLSYILYFLGMVSDFKTRKFKNKYLLCILILGIAYSILSLGFNAIYVLLLFCILTFIFIRFYEKNIIGAADLKTLSTAVLFVDFFNLKEMMIFSVLLCLFIILFTLYYLLKECGLSKEKWSDHFKSEILSFKELLYLKKFTKQTYKEDSKELMERTVPYTLPICFTIILSSLLIRFV